MGSINALGGSDSTWSSARQARAERPAGTPDPVRFKEAPFTTLDADGSGDIDARELDSLLSRLSQRSLAAAASGAPAAANTTTFGQMDSDASGSLSRYELDSGLKSLLGNALNTVAFAHARSASGAPGAGEATHAPTALLKALVSGHVPQGQGLRVAA